jgi:hypothetical protein
VLLHTQLFVEREGKEIKNMPKQIPLMCHAEKPRDETDPGLSPAGQTRATELATYIPQTFGAIGFLFCVGDVETQHSADRDYAHFRLAAERNHYSGYDFLAPRWSVQRDGSGDGSTLPARSRWRTAAHMGMFEVKG